MSTVRRFRPRYSDVAATIAVVLAMTGTAVAAAVPNNSVGTKQLKARAVTSPKLAPDAVITAKIANHAVTAGKLAANSVNGARVANGH